jgi:two-component system, OmpR family, phosphate regulon sensor histidine kinase PhoR
LSESLIRRVLILGMLSIVGIIAVQSYWLTQSWNIRDNDFDRTVKIALRNVAQSIAQANKSILPKYSIIQRKSSNVYVVNVNSKIRDFRKLEEYLKNELGNVFINQDFEYAVYDCASLEMIYGNYVKMTDLSKKKKKSNLPKFSHLDYYFVVKFPERQSYVVNNLSTNFLIFGIAALSVLFFTYSILVILKQKRLSDLQKDFINNMTHEFKTPISSIKIAADVFTKDQHIIKDSRLSKYANIIIEQNNRLNEQVEKVLNIARLENDTLKLNMELVDINDTLKTIVEANQLKLSNGSVTFDELITDVNIETDRLHFTNVVYNMIDNAVKYCAEVPNIIVRLYEKDNNIHMSISDNGIGIAKENTKNLFDKFYRVNTGNLHNVKGFGLGLFYVKSICDANKWEIEVTSTPGVGSTFDINMGKREEAAV